MSTQQIWLRFIYFANDGIQQASLWWEWENLKSCKNKTRREKKITAALLAMRCANLEIYDDILDESLTF